MKRIILSLAFMVLACCTAAAQNKPQAQAVASCGGAALTAGVFYPVFQDLTGTLCTAAGGGGGGGGAVTIANGADVALGSTTDSPASLPTSVTAATTVALLKALNNTATGPIPAQTSAVWIGNVGQNGAPWTFALNATPSLANGNGVVPTQGGSVLSATNGAYTNLLVGNAAVAVGTGPQGSTSPRTTVATDTATIAGSAPGAAGTPSPQVVSVQGVSSGTPVSSSADPCTSGTKQNFTIATSSGTVQIVAPSGSTQVYICSLITIGATASIQNIVGGTGATCTTGTPVAMAGSTTAANGMSFAANGGFTFGNGGASVLRTTTAGHGVCLIQSATAALAGGGTFVQQ
jgi:hypothetical protein